jgi:uncharacterized membrane protein
MTTKIIFLVTVLSYAVIASQPFMYILALKHAQMNLNANSYSELRKLIDIAMRNNFKYVLYTAVLANLGLIIANVRNPGGLVFITASISFIALILDIMLTIKGSLPINDVINTWPTGNSPANWTEYRDNWFRIFQYRQIASITGFLSLLIGTIFGGK